MLGIGGNLERISNLAKLSKIEMLAKLDKLMGCFAGESMQSEWIVEGTAATELCRHSNPLGYF